MAQATRLQALLDLARALSSSLDLREVLGEFASHAAELTGATAAELSTLDPARGDLVMLVEHVRGREEITVGGGQVYHLADYPRTRHVLETQEAVQIRVAIPTTTRPSARSSSARGRAPCSCSRSWLAGRRSG